MNTLTASLTEREGFEPPVPFSTTVFKTADLNQLAHRSNFQTRNGVEPFPMDLQSNDNPAISRVIYKNLIQRIRVVLLVDLPGPSPGSFNLFQVKFLTKLPTVFLKLGSNCGLPSKNIDTATKAFFQLALFGRKF